MGSFLAPRRSSQVSQQAVLRSNTSTTPRNNNQNNQNTNNNNKNTTTPATEFSSSTTSHHRRSQSPFRRPKRRKSTQENSDRLMKPSSGSTSATFLYPPSPTSQAQEVGMMDSRDMDLNMNMNMNNHHQQHVMDMDMINHHHSDLDLEDQEPSSNHALDQTNISTMAVAPSTNPLSFRSLFRLRSNNNSNNNGADTTQHTFSSRWFDESAPIYRQYIYDRIHGDSYIPKEHRGDNVHERTHCNDHHWHQKDPTSITERPPHWSCYVPPCVGRCAWACEQNACCKRQGRFGWHRGLKNHYLRRKPIFIVGFLLNCASLLLMIFASMAYAKNYRILTHTSFSRGTASILENALETLEMNVGFRAIAFTEEIDTSSSTAPGISGNIVVSFDDFCSDYDITSVGETIAPALCGDCRDSSQAFVLSCLINMILILRNMFSDITRMYPKYDLNCPKFTGSLLATMSFGLGWYTILAYQSRCFQQFDAELDPAILLRMDGFSDAIRASLEAARQQGETLTMHFDWRSGPGLTCLITATCFRFGDAMCNYLVPTPSITRDDDEQDIYEQMYGDIHPDLSRHSHPHQHHHSAHPNEVSAHLGPTTSFEYDPDDALMEESVLTDDQTHRLDDDDGMNYPSNFGMEQRDRSPSLFEYPSNEQDEEEQTDAELLFATAATKTTNSTDSVSTEIRPESSALPQVPEDTKDEEANLPSSPPARSSINRQETTSTNASSGEVFEGDYSVSSASSSPPDDMDDNDMDDIGSTIEVRPARSDVV